MFLFRAFFRFFFYVLMFKIIFGAIRAIMLGIGKFFNSISRKFNKSKSTKGNTSDIPNDQNHQENLGL